MTLSGAFNQFLNREVGVIEEEHVLTSPQGAPFCLSTYRLKDNPDPVIGEIEKLALSNNLQLRVRLPATLVTADYHPNRLNVFVSKQSEGCFRITRLAMG